MEYMFLPLKRYADFSGRSRRMEYWMWFVFQILVVVSFWVLMMVIGGAAMMGGGNASSLLAAGGGVLILFAVYSLVWLALIIPGLAVAVRRLHDTNRTGWWILAPLLPYILVFAGAGMASSSPGSAGIVSLVGVLALLATAVTLLVFMFLDGTPGPNRFGEDPKQRAAAEVFA